MKIIDSHLHLFDLEAGNYAWLSPQNPPYWPDKSHIAKDFCERDLALNAPFSLAGFVHVEAGFDNEKPWREVDHLSATCNKPFSAVAGFDLLDGRGDITLDKLLERKSVVGIRHILDEHAKDILTHPNASVNFKLLEKAGYSFDAQLSFFDGEGVEALINIAKQHPKLAVIINHAGFPLSGSAKGWQTSLQALASCENIAIKLSGWEMHDRHWDASSIAPWITEVNQQFGEDRVMLGSNFPLCTWRMSYAEFWAEVLTCIPASLQSKVAYLNTQRWYRVDVE